jgi:hypothetical protein
VLSNEIETDLDAGKHHNDDSHVEKQLLLKKALPKLQEIGARYPTVSPLKLMRRYKKLVAEAEKAAEQHMLREAEKEEAADPEKEKDEKYKMEGVGGKSRRPSMTSTTTTNLRNNKVRKG